MNAGSYQQEWQVALAAVEDAARLCQAVQQEITPEVIEKADRSPVTVADFGSQAVICQRLRQAFPDDPIMAEESSAALRQKATAVVLEQVLGHVQALRPEATATAVCDWIDAGRSAQYTDRFWTLDPIDGTKGFLRGDQYAISLALIVAGAVQLGLLCCPNLLSAGGDEDRGAVFAAVRGRGATVRPLWTDGPDQPIRVSSTGDPAAARFCESVESAHTRHEHAAAVARRLGISTEPKRLDSQAKYALVACGQADMYLRLPVSSHYHEKVWDHAGGAIIVSEAGGRVTDVDGAELDFTRGRQLSANRGVVASNGLLHDRLLEALGELA